MKTIIERVKFKAGPEKLSSNVYGFEKAQPSHGRKSGLEPQGGRSFHGLGGMYIRGKNFTASPCKTIVQTWRTTTFKRVDQDLQSWS